MKTYLSILFFLLLYLGIVPFVSAQMKHPANTNTGQNKMLWKSVDSLTNLGQSRSALEIVDKIYNKSRLEKNSPQVLKAILYRIRLNSDFQEDFLNQTVRWLTQEIHNAEEPATSVLHSVLAEVYWKYYQNNSYRFRDRTRVQMGGGRQAIRSDSLATWDLGTIAEAITNSYLLSLANDKLLKETPINSYEAILEITPDEVNRGKGGRSSRPDYTRPTLFDFLAFRALEYFKSDQGPRNLPADLFTLDKPEFFSPTTKFINLLGGPQNLALIYPTSDSISSSYFAFRIYQSLAAFHLKDKNPAALIFSELERLAFMKSKAPMNDTLYLNSLGRLENDHAGSPFSTEISFVIAEYLDNSGTEYSPLVSDKHKWDVKNAVGVCERAFNRFPDSEGAKNCKILEKSIRRAELQVTTESAVPVLRPSLALITFKNIKTLYFRLLQTDPVSYSEKSGALKREDFFKYIASFKPSKSWSVTLPDDGDFQRHCLETEVPGCPPGFYILLCSEDNMFSDQRKTYAMVPFWSTQISQISRRNGDGSITVSLLDRETGLPIKKSKAEAWVKNYNYTTRQYQNLMIGTYYADDNGLFTIPPAEVNSRNNSIYFRIQSGNDLYVTSTFYQYPVGEPGEYTVKQTSLFTDRAIYRPGQNIYFKGILLEKRGEKTRLLPDHKTKVAFYDVNGQKIAEQSFITNEFGSFNGVFTAPLGSLSGQMTISNESGSVSISLEEYKRPAFEVVFSPLEGNYKVGESVIVKGRAIAFVGMGTEGSTVKYRVVRSARFPFWGRGWYWPFPASTEVEIVNGVTSTVANGDFSFEFRAIPDLNLEKETLPVFDYEVYVDVTDPGLETQSARQTVSAGYTSLLIGISLPDLLNLSTDSLFKITTTNLNGFSTSANVTLKIRRLQQPGQVLKQRNWERPDIYLMTRDEFKSKFPFDIYRDEDNQETWKPEGPMFEQTFNTAVDSLFHFRNLPAELKMPGCYDAVLTGTDPYGQKVEKRIFFTVYDPDSREVPVSEIGWFVPLKTSGEPGEKAVFLLGSKEDNVNVMYEIRFHDTLVAREWINLNNRSTRIEIPIEERFRGNFDVNFVYVKHNRVFQHSQLITVPYTNRKLDIAFETFRSKLLPGSNEEWRISITGPGKKVIGAEFLATMYDASLDVIRPNVWSFGIYPRLYSLSPWDINDAFRTAHASWADGRFSTVLNYSNHPYYQLNWFGLNYFGNYGHNIYSKRSGRIVALDAPESEMAVGFQKDDKSGTPVSGETVADTSVSGIPVSDLEMNKRQPGTLGIQIRRDFRETAFFYPALVTDSTGRLIIKFTMPESLTRWKMMGLAHTKNLEYGQIEKELVTRKELMVFPNAPRFVRHGDTLVFTTRIMNLADRELSGEARLQLFDGITMKAINKLILPIINSDSLQTRSWVVGKDMTTTVSWTFTLPEETTLSVLLYRITAQSGGFSDGEEKAIPVLPNRMLITETLPLPVRGKGDYLFTFDKLLKWATTPGTLQTLKNYRLTLEFASNPAWYAVQALPLLNEENQDNADAIFSAFYANRIASFIASSNPKIKTVFEAWKTLTPDAFNSNLEKNEELKSVLLNETPWVLEAKSESERKQKLGRYFDLNNLNHNLQENLNKLQKLQKTSGAWTWYEGMPESRWITQNILTGLGHLIQIGVPEVRSDEATFGMINRAIQFLDSELAKDFESLKRDKKFMAGENHLSSVQIQYLYARSYFKDIKMQNPRYLKAYEFYLQQASEFWQKSDRYLQGMIALALHRSGKGGVAGLILKSLSEKAIHSPEMGMYWAGEHGYYWYQAPVETQAMMIEAFDEIKQDGAAVDEMKIWLLKQKQTQGWRSSRANTEAIYALLLRGTDLLSEESGVKIAIGKEKIDSRKLTDTKIEAGTGYFQHSWQSAEIVPEMGNIKVTKFTEGPAWGALYWQYFENLDKITKAASPLKLEKQLFREANTQAGPLLLPLSDTSLLLPGNKLKVRIVLTADRDLEFVHLKDMHAAAFEPPLILAGAPGTNDDGLSGYRFQDGVGYYQSYSDIATSYFFEFLPKGTYVFEYPLLVNASGDCSNGITTVQCLYAPEFSAHSEGIRVSISSNGK